ncbi:hypothetical protein M406DRAFT_321950 [Cryphonectria parasitica EP155]|uniref:Uncharacterized protein n=1 Tax=Cryphonectria parasitica (strain ATCC 38755 / EP155) TaxID=660469 RepID=A0A9P4Y2T2_CRYP1|nr:uncharacterized protein M406DRAFT_321950 [Cryphonectria parasitica EP155]KAF3765458.1 hypothetical protein M406DRAFT_321950 [Cryphonectria parasitica EP155]
MPHAAKAGGYEDWEHNAEISQVADHWLRYRISKIQGDKSNVRRLTLEAELAFVIGQRLVGDLLRLLPSRVAWVSPGGSEEALAARDIENDVQDKEGVPEEDEDASGERSLWPTAEAGATLRSGLSWAGYADRT